ncbi:cytochrome b [Lysobacter xinjiangensis]|uniref:Cytochrome b n=1 Tax=Cognatilysobacter xinjiangensis TaxID=546892 RepID=A0ABQ3BTJ6_9GAMM|nr:cytochrome b [Lysobacter xinjiangensis]GGZ53610.1 cytochrome b [Lysobacter xinjiangensis]
MSTGASLLPPRWGVVSQLFHWTCAALVIALGAIGLYMTELSSPVAKIRIYALHKSLGITLLALVVLRLLWRWSRPAPGPVPGMSRHLRLAADGTHGFLYVMMIAMPLSGWLYNSASGYPLQWFRRFNLPALAGKDEQLARLAHALHEYGFWLLLVLVVGHVGAALYHHLFLDDGTLHRMLPWRRRPPPPESLP